MMDRSTQLAAYTSFTGAVLRIMTGLVIIQHGMQKLFLFPPSPHHPLLIPLFSLFGMAGILEFFGGLLFMLGVCTRSVAFVLAGEMAVAYWMFHFPAGLHMPNGLFPVVNEGDLAIVLCFVFLHFAFVGAGSWSVDSWRARHHSRA